MSERLRPPAVPLITHTPYFSLWSMADRLTDDWAKHWTGATQGMMGILRVDGKPYRFSGPFPREAEAMEQRSVTVEATRTVYEFAAGGVALTLEFLSPLLADDLDLLARPVSYVSFAVRSEDGREHEVSAYLDFSGEFVVDRAHQPVSAARHRLAGLETLSLRCVSERPLHKVGDDVRIDWGALYVAMTKGHVGTTGIGHLDALRDGYVATGTLPENDDLDLPRPAFDRWPGLVFTFPLPLGEERTLMVAYDEEYALEYFGRPLRPYWRRDGATVADLLPTALAEFPRIRERCRAFDASLRDELTAKTSGKYADVALLAYRQCLAAHGLAEDLDGSLLHFSKENFSNGCIATVDVTYPGAPFFLKFNPELLRGQIEPVLRYAGTRRWKFPFAPHDLGTYPKANGQVYGGGETSERDQMPVEECGNMLALVAAYCDRTGDPALAREHWATLTKWADYLVEKGLDPENQLCTDDFAGHMAHNANLAVKAVMGIGCYAKLAAALGEDRAAYRAKAEEMAREWTRLYDDGAWYRLAFDQPGSWSQKYNLFWDRRLGLNLFPAEVARREIAHYLTRNTPYGLPLDSRRDYTKIDWIAWTATLAERPEDRRALLDPLWTWANETPSRVPLTDWYHTAEGGRQAAFQARSVVGGLFAPVL